jgi:AraC-like DNA-binding protein
MLNLDNLNIILLILPVYQLMFYVVQLVTLKKNGNPSRRPLGLLMFLMWIYLVMNAAGYLRYSYLDEYLYCLQLPALLAIMPTYYLYLRAVSITSGEMFSKPWKVVYLPAGFIFLLQVATLLTMNAEQSVSFLASGGSLSVNSDVTIRFAMMVSMLGYVVFLPSQLLIFSFQYVRKMRMLAGSRKNNPAYLPHFQPLWSHIILFSVIGFLVLGATMRFSAPDYNHLLTAFFNIGLLISGGLAGYFSLRQDHLNIEVAGIKMDEATDDIATEINLPFIPKSDNNYAVRIDDDEVIKIIFNLQHYLVEKKPYLNNKLSIVDLARTIVTTKQKLTYVINVVMETNFYGMINKYRVLEAKELLKRPENQNYTIDVISQMAGFQSKSSFNACFKKLTGNTPSEFRKNHRRVRIGKPKMVTPVN